MYRELQLISGLCTSVCFSSVKKFPFQVLAYNFAKEGCLSHHLIKYLNIYIRKLRILKPAFKIKLMYKCIRKYPVAEGLREILSFRDNTFLQTVAHFSQFHYVYGS